MTRNHFLTLFFGSIVCFACEFQEPLGEARFPEEVPPPTQEKVCLDDFPVCFIYETQSEEETFQSVFQEGENIVFSFEIQNLSERELTLKNEDVFQGNPDFLHIKNSQGQTVVELAKDFPFIYPSHFDIPANGSYRLHMSYENVSGVKGHKKVGRGEYQVSSPEGLPTLKPGKYHSSFTNNYIFRFAGEETEQIFSVPVSFQFLVQ